MNSILPMFGCWMFRMAASTLAGRTVRGFAVLVGLFARASLTGVSASAIPEKARAGRVRGRDLRFIVGVDAALW